MAALDIMQLLQGQGLPPIGGVVPTQTPGLPPMETQHPDLGDVSIPTVPMHYSPETVESHDNIAKGLQMQHMSDFGSQQIPYQPMQGLNIPGRPFGDPVSVASSVKATQTNPKPISFNDKTTTMSILDGINTNRAQRGLPPIGPDDPGGFPVGMPTDVGPNSPVRMPSLGLFHRLPLDSNGQSVGWKGKGFWQHIARIGEGIGNVAGDIFAPGTMALIPGTQMNRDFTYNRDIGQIAGIQEGQSKAVENQAKLAQARAEEARANKADKGTWKPLAEYQYTLPDGTTTPAEINDEGKIRPATNYTESAVTPPVSATSSAVPSDGSLASQSPGPGWLPFTDSKGNAGFIGPDGSFIEKPLAASRTGLPSIGAPPIVSPPQSPATTGASAAVGAATGGLTGTSAPTTTTPPAAKGPVLTRVAPREPAAATPIPQGDLGDRNNILRDQYAQRFPGKPMPPELLLKAGATEKDYADHEAAIKNIDTTQGAIDLHKDEQARIAAARDAASQNRFDTRTFQENERGKGLLDKADAAYNSARQGTDDLLGMISKAVNGDKQAAQMVPLAGALEITTASGVHRINRTEVDQYAGGGSLYDRVVGGIHKGLFGVGYDKDMLDSMQKLTAMMNSGAYDEYARAYTQAVTRYGLDPTKEKPRKPPTGYTLSVPDLSTAPTGHSSVAWGSDGHRHWLDKDKKDLGVVE